MTTPAAHRDWGSDVLAGEVVLELSYGIAGASCTKVLADAGAKVTKVEDPGGDPLRRRSPLPLSPDGDGSLFRYLAQSKDSVVLEPDASADARIQELAAAADVIVWSTGSLVASRPATSPARLHEAHPRAVVCAISPFGLHGPWAGRPASDLTLQAWAGGIGHRGPPEGPPVTAGGAISEWATGVFAAVGILTARHRARITGEGDLLDVSALESVAVTCALNYPVTFEAMAGHPIRSSRFQNLPGIHRAKDGWGGFMVITGQQWHDFCALIGRPDWIEDDSLLLFDNRVARRDELLGVIDEWMADRTLDEMLDLAASFRVPAAPLGNGMLTPGFAQPASEGLYEREPDGTFLQPVPPYRFSSGSGRRRPRPAPRLGERAPTAGKRPRRVRSTSRTTPGSRGPTTPPPRPLEGLRVADLTAYWAGPIVGRHLAMMGADVIRIESPDKLDGLRFTTPRGFDEPDWWEWAPMVSATNIGKRHLGLDLSTPRGREVLLRLVTVSDVVIENFTPRVMENWGLDPDRLLAAQPGLVVMRLPGFGLTGPWRDRPAYAQIMEMISGMAWVTGLADGPPLLPNGQCDPIGGHQALTALLLALEQRRQTGVGLVVECPLLLGALQVAAEQVVAYSGDGVLLERLGNRDPSIAPQGIYRCADGPSGSEAWVAISVPDDRTWIALRDALGRPAWATATAMDHVDGRRAAHDVIDEMLTAWCSGQPASDVVDALWRADVPVAKVMMPHEQQQLEQLRARGFFEEVHHPLTGTMPHATFPVRFSSIEGPCHQRYSPMLGEHNRDVLHDLLQLSEEEIDQLERERVIGTAPRPVAGG